MRRKNTNPGDGVLFTLMVIAFIIFFLCMVLGCSQQTSLVQPDKYLTVFETHPIDNIGISKDGHYYIIRSDNTFFAVPRDADVLISPNDSILRLHYSENQRTKERTLMTHTGGHILELNEDDINKLHRYKEQQ